MHLDDQSKIPIPRQPYSQVKKSSKEKKQICAKNTGKFYLPYNVKLIYSIKIKFQFSNVEIFFVLQKICCRPNIIIKRL